MILRKLLHRHRWMLTTPFTLSGGFVWPPIWACPCGETRDVMSMSDWGLES